MRPKWKGIFIHTILYKFANTKAKNYGPTWLNQKINLRSSVYIKKFLSRSLMIHNGFTYVTLKSYNSSFVGIKIGQFTYNRLFPRHSLKSDSKKIIYKKILDQHNKIEYKNKKTKFKNLKSEV